MKKPIETPNLKLACAAGGVMGLFPLLKDWPKSQLLALRKEIEAVWGESEKRWEELQFLPENFFSDRRSEALAAARMHVLAVLSEISSVICFYLDE
jgi:hypothetical protein